MQGRHSLVVTGIQVSTPFDEQRGGFLSTGAGRVMQGGRAPIIPRVHIRARSQMLPDGFDVPLPRSLVNRNTRCLNYRFNGFRVCRRLRLPSGAPHKQSSGDGCDEKFVPFDFHVPFKSKFQHKADDDRNSK
jgi:hypothetical protein